MIQNLMFGNEKQQLEVVKILRQHLSNDPDLFVDILGGIVPKFVEFLKDGSIKLQFEAAWALTNIASGNSLQTKCVVDNTALPALFKLLSSPCENVQEQAVWCLGNIVADGPEYRDLALDHGFLAPLLQYVFNEIKRTFWLILLKKILFFFHFLDF